MVSTTDSVVTSPYDGITMTEMTINGENIDLNSFDEYAYSSYSDYSYTDENMTNATDDILSAFSIYASVMSGIMIGISFMMLIVYVINFKLYVKLGMSRNTAMWAVIVPFVSLVLSVLEIEGLMTLWSIATVIISFYLQFKFYQLIGINPWLMFTVFIPIVGFIFAIYLAIKQTINLGDMFKKGSGFKLGLFFLAPIFRGILAFNDNEQPIGVEDFGRNF